jgi:tyrosyl-tRNA synthetase
MNYAKEVLACEVTALVHGRNAAEAAVASARAAFCTASAAAATPSM